MIQKIIIFLIEKKITEIMTKFKTEHHNKNMLFYNFYVITFFSFVMLGVTLNL
jgi:hypothetical protein